MLIESLRIENFGEIKEFKAEFGGGLNVICSEYWPDILSIMAIVSGSRILGFNSTRHIFTPNTRIYAAISGNFGKTEVELFNDNDCEHCCAGKFTINGRLSSFKELQVAIAASPEEEECSVFINEHDYHRYMPFAEYNFTRKLNSYLKYAPQSGKECVMDTPQLKEDLHGFISSFEPVTINSSKDMWLSITDNGVFVPLWHGEVRHDLSTAERAIFNYLCFVEVNAFWGHVAAKCHSIERLPLFIGDFTHFIDSATDIIPFISRATSLGRQTFLFCRNEHTLRRFGVCKAFKFNDTKEDK